MHLLYSPGSSEKTGQKNMDHCPPGGFTEAEVVQKPDTLAMGKEKNSRLTCS
jgi:hypothetical protein